MKVLVVDDDPSILDAITIMLEGEGYLVSTMTNGQTVYDLSTNIPDVLLLDVQLPGVNGKLVAKHLKSQSLTKNIPIIMTSANLDLANITKESGADDYIAKPFDINDLIGKMKKYTTV